VKLVNGKPDPTEPDNRLMNDEPLTSQALAAAARILAAG
jgi:hypothetical protein